jgi:AmiR/NasT family two-component response regulator
MRELVLATISEHEDIEVVGEVQDDSKIAETVNQLQPDFLIIALDKPERRPSICDFILEHYPHMKILAIAPESNSSIFYWAKLNVRANRIETSERGILGALRGQIELLPSATNSASPHKIN